MSLEIGAFWVGETKEKQWMLSGASTLDADIVLKAGTRLFVFENTNRQNDRAPHFRLLVSAPSERGENAPAPPPPAPARSQAAEPAARPPRQSDSRQGDARDDRGRDDRREDDRGMDDGLEDPFTDEIPQPRPPSNKPPFGARR